MCLLFLSNQLVKSIYKQQELQVAELSQRDHAAGLVSYGRMWEIGTGRQYLRTLSPPD